MTLMALTTKDLADELGTDGKTLRKFLRSHLPKDSQPGQGGRYSFEKKDLASLKKAWLKWSEKRDAEDVKKPTDKTDKKTKSEKTAKTPKKAVEEVDDEPTAAALEEIEDADLEDLDDLLED
jgi:hypothetical protein